MEKKYILTNNDIVNYNGHVLYRIKAVRSFGDVRKGDLGGYIESEDNLSHEGNAWIKDNAFVFENARVSGDALVYDIAEVYNNACISENAKIGKHAKIYNNAKVRGQAYCSDSARVFRIFRFYWNSS